MSHIEIKSGWYSLVASGFPFGIVVGLILTNTFGTNKSSSFGMKIAIHLAPYDGRTAETTHQQIFQIGGLL